MQITREQLEPTKVKLTITANSEELANIKQHVLRDLRKNIKVPGFREGKAPDNLIEKQVDPSVLQSEFLDHAVNDLYGDAINAEKIRPVAPPQISVTKFVPFGTLEFTAETEAIGEVKLADYKKIKVAPKQAEVTAEEVTTVLNNLRQRGASKTKVERAAKNNDEVTIDFNGYDAKTNESIQGTDGVAYPLVPGFEEELIGLKTGDSKSFEIVFPKDYNVADLQNRKVTFTVKVKKVQELVEPKLDDEFAATVGPFTTAAELKADIKKQLKAEKEQENVRAFDNELLEKIATKSEVAVPQSLIEQEIDRMEEEEKRNLVYRGQTWQEHLDAEGLTAEEHREKQREGADLRVKGGLVLGEISQKEDISVTPEELEIRIQLLKGQYPDPEMQAELDKDESRRDIASRLLTEKTLDKLRSYATS
jgi:trigger factor